MNLTALKTYAPQARKDFIQAMKDRAAFYGITEKKTEPIIEKGNVAVISGREFPRSVAAKRTSLEKRINESGFHQTMEALAYTWFNRFVAIRYMELHGYLDHGYRVLSHPEGKSMPEILEHAEHIDLPGIDKNTIIDLKLAGHKESELYRLLLIAQCNALHSSMPFLFERIDDETELLLPDNLLSSDSLIRKLVNGNAEADWDKVEILGWLYQFYISDKKDEVIGSVVASEDIPAATQLFTPNWIVKYLVQNTLGRQWLATYPNSALRTQMEYYIKPAEQEPEVVRQLTEITPESLNPEEITFLDPACGSGHILVEAYDLFKAIYQERGYRSKDIPALILQKNLFGFEIDDRASQLAMFALTMKAREDDRNLFQTQKGELGIQPKILCFVESKDLNPESIIVELNANISGIGKGNIPESDIAELVALFEHAKTFGSLIQIPKNMVSKLPGIEERLQKVEGSGDLSWMGLKRLVPLIQQATMLSQKYDAVVANPPYMGGKAMSAEFKAFAKEMYPSSKSDAFALFMERSFSLAKKSGYVGKVTMQSWMFLSSYEELRSNLLNNQSLICMAHLGARGFDSIGGEVVQTTAYVSINQPFPQIKSVFHRLLEGKSEAEKARDCLEAIRNKSCGWFYEAKPDDFKKIPGSPIAYWVSEKIRDSFSNNKLFSEYFFSDGLTKTGDNETYLRLHWELEHAKAKNPDSYRVCSKGGDARSYFGNLDILVNWYPKTRTHYRIDNVARITPYYLWDTSGISWTKISTKTPTFRWFGNGMIAETGGPTIFLKESSPKDLLWQGLGFLSSKVCKNILTSISPTVNFQTNDVLSLPFIIDKTQGSITITKALIEGYKADWDSFETSWDFNTLPILQQPAKTIAKSQEAADTECMTRFAQMKQLEEENNRLFINAYDLQDELTPEVLDDQITLHRPDLGQDIKRLISYAIGCMMGRYSPDHPGLIYANSGNDGFDPTQYKTFPADEDGIIPLLNTDWGIADDATDRVVDFLKAIWPIESLEENLFFISQSLGATPKEPSRDVIRNYFSTSFYKDHLQKYKKRPIYWLFSSGKLKAFQCLVYLHRYNESTLSRMRTQYVHTIQSLIAARIEQLEGDKLKATSTSHRNKLQKEQDGLKKQQEELKSFEEKLKQAAERKIKLDLDDGVKVNYAKFTDNKYGELLAEVKAICGTKDEE